MYFDITPDEEFTKTEKVPGPTKEEIRALVISKMRLSDKDVVVDIGCGTGGLTVEFAKRAKNVFSVDINPDAIKTTRTNLEKLGLENKVELIQEEGFQALDQIDDFTRIMIGGSNGNLDNIIEEAYIRLPVGGRIVITSIVLETATDSVRMLKDLGAEPEVVNLCVSKGVMLERGVMMKALNPITIITARKQ
ncbi:precorrin-6Y C5,15-methyltransferase (decarboxylating) subunit CbiT [Methanosphaera cuniculi]|uniref:precorrin-6Y C5,15-methyltransferase (decarboxylating) subunit CbiT n=1 Tax=Methanosphaera cuniculi TaxID=1077256 RepID=UPI0026F10FB4|nr:precorrin-6Y C5,15-methyltransferase (decarboxylating) subunit CbiT [Methanosphaera cuniculi]